MMIINDTWQYLVRGY